jgi:hypothetical protein
MFLAFPGNRAPLELCDALGRILLIAAILYAVTQAAVFAILSVAGSTVDPNGRSRTALARRWLASLGNLGTRKDLHQRAR